MFGAIGTVTRLTLTSIFSTREYYDFNQGLKAAFETIVEPADRNLQDLMPEMCAEIRGTKIEMLGRVSLLQNQVNQISASISRIESNLLRPVNAQRVEAIQNAEVPPIENAGGVNEAQVQHINQENRIASVKMSRDPNMDIRCLWQEWDAGLKGNPSIRELELTKEWRAGPYRKSESRFFQRRKRIIDQIIRRMDSGMTVESAILQLEEIRNGKSLNWLSDNISLADLNRST